MNITVYLGANAGNDPALAEAVRELGSWIGANGHRLVYGGSRSGLMGQLAQSALDAGGTVTGVEPQFFVQQELQHDGLTELIVTKDMTERKTRNEKIILVPNRRAETTVRALDAIERKLGAEKFGTLYKSITVDNGTEFAMADEIERSCLIDGQRTKVYYCHPYSSWERGSNENVNGMIRRRHPKGTNFANVTQEEIAATENWINNYPRKIHGYKSAATMFRQCLRELGLTA